jgi:hypothetical protein
MYRLHPLATVPGDHEPKTSSNILAAGTRVPIFGALLIIPTHQRGILCEHGAARAPHWNMRHKARVKGLAR